MPCSSQTDGRPTDCTSIVVPSRRLTPAQAPSPSDRKEIDTRSSRLLLAADGLGLEDTLDDGGLLDEERAGDAVAWNEAGERIGTEIRRVQARLVVQKAWLVIGGIDGIDGIRRS